MKFLQPSLYILGLYGAYVAGSAFLRSHASKPKKPAVPFITFLLLLLVGIPSSLQIFFTAMLSALQRDYSRFIAGEWWRLVTPLVVQDGGISGALFNLVSLFLVGSIAEQLWGKRNTVLLFIVGGIIGQVVAFAWQPTGAGNSVANFSLAASIAVACLLRQSSRIVRIAASLALGADAVLVVLHDIHGAAALAGALLAFALNRIYQAWVRE